MTQKIIAGIILAAAIAIALVACSAMGVPIPHWVWTIFGIVLVAVVAILAIKFVASQGS